MQDNWFSEQEARRGGLDQIYNPHSIQKSELDELCYIYNEKGEVIEKSFSSDLKDKFPDSEWRTINGSHVLIHGGKVVAGLAGFNGKIDQFFTEKKEKETSNGKEEETKKPMFKYSDRDNILNEMSEKINNYKTIDENFKKDKKTIDNTIDNPNLKLFASKKQINDFNKMIGTEGSLEELKENSKKQIEIIRKINDEMYGKSSSKEESKPTRDKEGFKVFTEQRPYKDNPKAEWVKVEHVDENGETRISGKAIDLYGSKEKAIQAAKDKINKDRGASSKEEKETKEDIGTFKPARYAKDKIAYTPPKSTDNWKTREARLASAETVNGKFSHRENAYIMSSNAAERLKKYIKEGYDASAFTGKLEKPESSKEETKPTRDKEDFHYKDMPKKAAEELAQYWGNKKMMWNKGEINLSKPEIAELTKVSKMIDQYHPELNKYLSVQEAKKENKSFPSYKEAIKLPKGGAVAMNDNNLQAAAAEMIARKHAFNPEAVYNWANKHNVDLKKNGYILSDIKNNSAFMEDILNDKYDKSKKLIEKEGRGKTSSGLENETIESIHKKISDLTDEYNKRDNKISRKELDQKQAHLYDALNKKFLKENKKLKVLSTSKDDNGNIENIVVETPDEIKGEDKWLYHLNYYHPAQGQTKEMDHLETSLENPQWYKEINDSKGVNIIEKYKKLKELYELKKKYPNLLFKN